MNGEDRQRRGESIADGGLGAKCNNGRCSVPVVGVEDVGADEAGGGGRGASEEDIAAVVVQVGSGAVAVDAVAIEEAWMVGHIDRYAAGAVGAQDAEGFAIGTHGKREAIGNDGGFKLL